MVFCITQPGHAAMAFGMRGRYVNHYAILVWSSMWQKFAAKQTNHIKIRANRLLTFLQLPLCWIICPSAYQIWSDFLIMISTYSLKLTIYASSSNLNLISANNILDFKNRIDHFINNHFVHNMSSIISIHLGPFWEAITMRGPLFWSTKL